MKRISVILLLLVFIAGCSQKERVEYPLEVINNDWEVTGKLYKDGKSEWYIDSEIKFLRDEEIEHYTIELVAPDPLKVVSKLESGSTDILKIVARLEGTALQGSKKMTKDNILLLLEKSYYEFQWEDFEGTTHVEQINIIEEGAH